MDEEIEEKNITSALFMAMKEMKSVIRDKTGSTGKRDYKYAELSQVLDVVKPALEKHNLMLLQGTTPIKDDIGGFNFMLDTFVVYVPTGEKIKLDSRSLISSSQPKEQGSYETYMRRYSLLMAFNLAPEDDDGDDATVKHLQNAKQDNPVDHIAEPTKKAIGETCIKYAETFGLNPDAYKQSVWQELKTKMEPDWLKKLSWMRSEIEKANERPME